ncbi:hypothetical protein [Croceicoccus pelagius]|nr:hypothetical protein [Croceicoccus pelagius]
MTFKARSMHNEEVVEATILRELAAEIERLGEAFCKEPDVIDRFMTELQSMDRIAQTQRALAGLIEAGASPAAIDAAVLDAIKARYAGKRRPAPPILKRKDDSDVF